LTTVIKKEFIPSQDQGRFLARITLPLGSSIEKTNSVFLEAEKFLMSRKEVETYFSAVGSFSGGQVNQGFLFITMKDRDKRPMVNGHRETQAEFMQIARKAFSAIPGVDRAVIQDLSLSGFTAQRGFPILGDRRYGSKLLFAEDALALHAREMVIRHPTLDKEMHFVADPEGAWKKP